MANDTSQTDGKGGAESSAPPSRFHTDVRVAIVIASFCTAVFLVTTTFEKVPSVVEVAMQPADYPRLLLVAIFALAAIMFVQSRHQPDKRRKPIDPVFWKTFTAMVLFLCVAEWIGLFVAIILFCTGMPLVWGERRIVIVGLFAVTIPAAVFVVFGLMLEIRFPRGLLTNLIY